jgi:hypothetical protein
MRKLAFTWQVTALKSVFFDSLIRTVMQMWDEASYTIQKKVKTGKFQYHITIPKKFSV